MILALALSLAAQDFQSAATLDAIVNQFTGKEIGQ
jgi:hypothetical protein